MRDPVTKQTNKQQQQKTKQANHKRITTAAQGRPRYDEDELTGGQSFENKMKPKSIKPWLPMPEEIEDKAVACRAP